MRNIRPFSLRASVLVLASALLLAGCDRGDDQAAAQGAASAPPPAVTVIEVQTQTVAMQTELPGRTAPYLIAEVRPQVTGLIQERAFEEGSEVEAGQLLYQIDPSSYQAAYDSAKAEQARAEADLYSARLTADRYAELVKTNAISKQANDEAVAALRQAQAGIAAAKAALDKAEIDLAFTRVTAPIAGRIGRSRVTAGALVTANQPEALAVIQQLDPIYVDLTQSSVELLRMRRDLAAGNLERLDADTVPVSLLLEDGSAYGIDGKLAFSEVSVDEATGSVTLRAVFPNPDGELLPGMYVRAQLSQGSRDNMFLVPHAALTRDPRGNAVVMVVDATGTVEPRTVEVEQSRGDQWLVSAGLRSGERIIIEGLQRVQPGMQVQAQTPEQAATQAAPAAGSDAAAE
ncbi:MAG: efflux RND transporter periplasmic adaptor subunit [Thiohalobacteraceae bacterium]